MNDPLNTHNYDGKLHITDLPQLLVIKELPLDQKRQRGLELLEAAKVKKINKRAISYLRKIISSMGSTSNIDSTNKLVADDLICLCWEHKDNPIFLSNLEDQLIDMRTGFCPQGRTHRLFQILLAFERS